MCIVQLEQVHVGGTCSSWSALAAAAARRDNLGHRYTAVILCALCRCKVI